MATIIILLYSEVQFHYAYLLSLPVSSLDVVELPLKLLVAL